MNNRKDDHIRYALSQQPASNHFDMVRFVPHSMPSLNIDMIDCHVDLFGHRFNWPVYINAMTGGTNKALEINTLLAKLAQTCDLAIASGSLSTAIKDPSTKESFQTLRKHHPQGFIFANIGLSYDALGAQKAIDILHANALQVHLNAPQEIAMPEGDKDFTQWEKNLQSILSTVKVPVIVKEVGFGMSKETIHSLVNLGVDTIDVSGTGGTNFIQIENQRAGGGIQGLENYGFSTVESLLEAKHLDVCVLASGGVRNAYDVVKCLALGAKMVGLSRFFLDVVVEYPLEEAILRTKQFLTDIKHLMVILQCQTIADLRKKPLLFDPLLLSFMHQRQQ